jgi:hypothetical protein
MSDENEFRRLQIKSPEQKFLQILTQEYRCSPRVAEALLVEAQTCLLGKSEQLRPGQVRAMLAKANAPVGRALKSIALVEVIWTVDAGLEDQTLLRQAGRPALRRVRIQRLLAEALDQGAVATQEDLARALHSSLRTIKRDCKALQAQRVLLPSRGYLKGVGRGQTHKAQIIRHWLQGKTYDQIELHTRHTASAIQRYIRAFVQVVQLQRRGYPESEIALLLQLSPCVVQEYLGILEENQTPASLERLESQLARFSQAAPPKKGEP